MRACIAEVVKHCKWNGKCNGLTFILAIGMSKEEFEATIEEAQDDEPSKAKKRK